jgi:multidrug efflux pump subunit AcrA (membrane-fusion protein)
MFATAEFETGETRPAVQIPESAVQEMNGKAVVFVRRESGSFDAREVRVGQRTGDRVEVLAGLRAGDSVVVNGAFLLKTELKKVSGD